MCKHQSGNHTEAGEDSCSPVKAGITVRLCVVLLNGYRYLISPLFPPTCRYIPTCSQYAVDAVVKYGAFRGLYLAFCRLLRCHPFAEGGYDPVK